MFNSLVAVLRVLKEIHGVDDNTEDMKRFADQRVYKKAKAL
jgi:hypothetical protein